MPTTPVPFGGRIAGAWQSIGRWHPRTRAVLAATALWLVGACHLTVAPLAPLTRLDLFLADVRQSIAQPPVARPRDDIVIVDVDDASLREIGRWPWPRDRLARLVATLFDDDHAAALGIDFVFSEPDDQGRAVHDALRSLAELAPADARLHAGIARWQGTLEGRADHDARFAQALAGRPVTLAYHFNHEADQRSREAPSPTRPAEPGTIGSGDLPAPLTEPGVLPARALAMTPWQGIEAPVPALLHAAAGVGFINAQHDPDGELRTTPLVTAYDGGVYESFALSLWRQWRHASAARPVIARGIAGGDVRLTGLQLSDANGAPLRELRVDERGGVTLPYRRAIDPGRSPGSGRFRYIPAADVLAHRVGARELQGRVVLLGSSAPGLADLRATPVHQALPGIEVHAQLLAGLEDGDLAVRPDWAAGFELLLLAGVLAGVTIAMRRLSGPAAILALAGVVGALLAGDLLALTLRGWALTIAAPLVGSVVLGVAGLVSSYIAEWHSRRALARLFGHYLPPERVRAMARDPDRFLDIASSAENRELTVLFCDLRGFTPMAEHLAPERLRELLNVYFSRMSEIVHAHDGTLDKFIGDAVMAFWGAPQPDARHAEHAVRAAIAMVEAVAPLNAELAARGLPPVAPCVGLATGVVCVGDLGSARRRSYTAVGDGVNLAARVEGLTRSYGVPLLVADTTRDAAGDMAGQAWVEVDVVAVKGRSQRAAVYALLAFPPTAEENQSFHEQLRLWRLARDALRGHHGASMPTTETTSACAVATARLDELLDARPAWPELQALATRWRAVLAAPEPASHASNPDPTDASSPSA